MFAKLTASGRRIIASYIRALVGMVGAVQAFDVFDARGWAGVLKGALVATVPAILRAVEALAADISPEG